MNLILSPNELQLHFDKASLVQACADQIAKDFDMFGVCIHFSGNTEGAYLELHSQLVAQIDVLLRESSSKLIAVLYRIDISDEELKMGEKMLPNYNAVEAMAHTIIVRELKKVISRNSFNQDENEKI